MIDVCADCTERRIGCHATCERYKDAKAKHEERKAKIRKAKTEEAPYLMYVRDKKGKERK